MTYYAVAPGNTAGTLPPTACTTGTSCLSVANVHARGTRSARS